jgi:hypothetical protein
MNILRAGFDNWEIQYSPDDGARIVSLNYAGHDLLTSPPVNFKPPDKFRGEFETRPVSGYDDCFPTVDPCAYPGGDDHCRDLSRSYRDGVYLSVEPGKSLVWEIMWTVSQASPFEDLLFRIPPLKA